MTDIDRALAQQIGRHRPHVILDAPNPRDVLGGDDERPLFLVGKVGRP
jgi:hypothetical protein